MVGSQWRDLVGGVWGSSRGGRWRWRWRQGRVVCGEQTWKSDWLSLGCFFVSRVAVRGGAGVRRAGFLVASGLVLASVQIKAVKIQDPDNPQKKLDDFWGPSQKMLNDLGPDKFKQGELNVSLPSSFAF